VKRALVTLKPTPHYRREAFEAGLRAAGFDVVKRLDKPEPGDVLCTWNLTGSLEQLADTFRRRGGQVIVTENGYLTPPGRPGMYAVSLGGHCGAGSFPVGGPERWQALGITPKPWRIEGKHILVVGQRGIGSRAMASPHAWHQKIAAKLQTVTRRRIVVRPHPGAHGRGRPLADDLRDAHAVVVWSSSVGVHALIEGIPTYFAAPHWICAGAAHRLERPEDLEQGCIDDQARLEALSRMAWGQWTYQEIATGEPLQKVLNDAH
jgi:hypothetical protein